MNTHPDHYASSNKRREPNSHEFFEKPLCENCICEKGVCENCIFEKPCENCIFENCENCICEKSFFENSVFEKSFFENCETAKAFPPLASSPTDAG